MITPGGTLASVLTLLLVGCGARTGTAELEVDAAAPPPDAFVGRDAGPRVRTDGGVDAGTTVRACARSCGWCRPAGDPVALSAQGQTPDVTWDGEKLLVVHDHTPGVTVQAVDLDGTIRWTDDLEGLQWARIAFDRAGRAGMVVVDSGVQWLGSDGRPVGDLVRLPFPGWQLRGDISATSSGFLLMTGAGSFGGEPPGLFFDRFGRAPGGLSLEPLASPGPRAPPEHATDEDGRATLVASTTWDGSAGELYLAGAGGEPSPLYEIGSEHGPVIGVARGRADDVFLLRSRTGWSLWLDQVFDDETVRSTLLGESPRGASGHMIEMGGRLVVASPVLDDEHRVSVTCLDPLLPEPGAPPRVLATRAYSHSPRLASTPRGYAVVWTETDDTTTGLIPMLQVMECCVEE